MEFIVINHPVESITLPVDTLEQIEAAKAAMVEHGVSECIVWSGNPDDGDSVETSKRLFV